MEAWVGWCSLWPSNPDPGSKILNLLSLAPCDQQMTHLQKAYCNYLENN